MNPSKNAADRGLGAADKTAKLSCKALPSLAALVLAALLLGGTASQANPIFVDAQFWPRGRRAWDESRQKAMISENVDVTVGGGESTVSGRYTFRGPVMRALGSYEIYIPVLLPAGYVQKYRAGNGEPVLRWGKRRLPMEPAKARPGFPTVSLPAGWQMAWFSTAIPWHEVRGNLEAHITYIQPNFPDGSVGYVSLNPPKRPGAGRIVFTGKDSQLLRSSGLFSFLSPAQARLEFPPRHRKLIRVQQVGTNSR